MIDGVSTVVASRVCVCVFLFFSFLFFSHVPSTQVGVRPAFLLQGTLYPDVIESVSYKGPTATIKTHHNVGGLPEKMDMALIEPLRELFKVRFIFFK